MKIKPEKDPTKKIKVKTNITPGSSAMGCDWWNSSSDRELSDKLLSTVEYLKAQSQQRTRNAALFARLYGNHPLSGIGGMTTKLTQVNTLPIDRPTMSVITSGVDTIVSRLTINKPRPIFLTDNSDYKQRTLAKQMNNFILGEFYRNKAYELGRQVLRDASVIGTGFIKVLSSQDNLVKFERKLLTEVYFDETDAYYGYPRMLYELKLMDRSVLNEYFPNQSKIIDRAGNATVDRSSDSTKTIADVVMAVEAWRLPSGNEADDGLHVVACDSGILLQEKWTRQCFPFVKINYADRMVGYLGQGLAERGMGTQMGINQLLQTIHRSINIAGTPKVLVEDGSGVVKAHINNEIGAIVTYKGTPPQFITNQSNQPELYQQLERLIRFFYEQEGISQLSAQAKKPAGLNSGIALREYDDNQSERFNYLQQQYEQMYVELAYQTIWTASDICERTGSYSTVYPNKDGVKVIELPKAKELDDTYVFQCFDMSSLPRDPAGRSAKIVELMQAGIYTQDEGRRLLGFSDTEQIDKLKGATEERIFKILDEIVETGKFTSPDPFMNLDQAEQRAVQYYNLYASVGLPPDRLEKLRNFISRCQTMKKQMMAAMQPPAPPIDPLAVPEPAPTSEMMPI